MCFLIFRSAVLSCCQAMTRPPSIFPGLHSGERIGLSATIPSLYGFTSRVYPLILRIIWNHHMIVVGGMRKSTNRQTTYSTISTETPTTCLNCVCSHHLGLIYTILTCTTLETKSRRESSILCEVTLLFESLKEIQSQFHVKEQAYPPCPCCY